MKQKQSTIKIPPSSYDTPFNVLGALRGHCICLLQWYGRDTLQWFAAVHFLSILHLGISYWPWREHLYQWSQQMLPMQVSPLCKMDCSNPTIAFDQNNWRTTQSMLSCYHSWGLHWESNNSYRRLYKKNKWNICSTPKKNLNILINFKN